jgi:lincosamide nucleotidyltransferase A/C/D/E
MFSADSYNDTKSEMTTSALVELLELLDAARIPVWLDGGWGVDALLGERTRPHRDVDIILRVADVPKLLEIMGSRGFAIKEGVPPSSFVLADGLGLKVDVHAVVFDDDDNGVYRMQNGEDWIYPAEGFDGQGVIAGRSVSCLSPEAQVLCHANGYAPTEKDLRDMARLQERFGVELPPHLRAIPTA